MVPAHERDSSVFWHLGLILLLSSLDSVPPFRPLFFFFFVPSLP